ncbi:hypothetical protein FVEN_g12718 [Fusarium venenatum]|nr:hypothetical protein FVEN_g12718 [Fusarium venenatum]
MFETGGHGLLRIIGNAKIFNLETLIPDLEKIHGQGKIAFIQKGPVVIVTIETDDLAGLAKVYAEMGFMVSTEERS